MKKITTLFFLFLILNLFKGKIDTKHVFHEQETMDNNVEICEIELEELTNKNILNKLNFNDIISITPSINTIYEKLFSENKEYVFLKGITKENNIKKFTDNYQKILDDNGLKTELSKTIVNGIKIKNVKLKCDEKVKNKLKELNILYKITH